MIYVSFCGQWERDGIQEHTHPAQCGHDPTPGVIVESDLGPKIPGRGHGSSWSLQCYADRVQLMALSSYDMARRVPTAGDSIETDCGWWWSGQLNDSGRS